MVAAVWRRACGLREELERLDDELNFADATAAEFDVALQFAGLYDFVFMAT